MRRIGWLAVFMTVAVVPLLGLGCGSSGSRMPESTGSAMRVETPREHERIITLTNSDSGRSVAAAVGSEIDVTLQTIGPGQYGIPTLSSTSVRFLGVSMAGSPNPGGPDSCSASRPARRGERSSPSSTRVACQEAPRRLPSTSPSRCTEPHPVPTPGSGAPTLVREMAGCRVPAGRSSPERPTVRSAPALSGAILEDEQRVLTGRRTSTRQIPVSADLGIRAGSLPAAGPWRARMGRPRQVSGDRFRAP